MKKKILTILFITTIFSISVILRLWNLDKPDGMWFDEYCTYNVIDTDSFWNVIKLNLKGIGTCQPPFYFLLLWGWMQLFGNSDWVLRFLSVILGCFSVIAAYFCGKDFDFIQKDNIFPSKTGIIFSVLFSISSIAIYYSQEMRVYSLVIFLSTLLLLSILRLVIQVNNKNLFFLIWVNCILLYTHTLAYAFCFFEFLLLFIYFYKKDVIEFKKLIISAVILLILCIPGIYSILNNSINVSCCWTIFNLNAIFSFINAYVSPFLFNVNSHGVNLFSIVFIPFLIFSFPLIVIYLIALIKTIKKVSISRYLFITCILFICTLAFLNIQGKISFIPRYAIEILPFLLLFVSYGLTTVKGHLVNTKTLLGIILCLNLVFMLGFPEHNAQHISKQIFFTNFKDLSKTLNKYEFQPQDNFVIVYYGSTPRFISARKYFDFSEYKNYIFHHCAFNYNDYVSCMEKNKIYFQKTIQRIKEETPSAQSLIFVIPSDIFDFYEQSIIDTDFSAKYKLSEKIDKNKWITLIYSNPKKHDLLQ